MGPTGRKFQAQRNDLGTKEFRNSQNRDVASLPQLERQGYERMDIAESAEAGENNAHALLLQCNAITRPWVVKDRIIQRV